LGIPHVNPMPDLLPLLRYIPLTVW